MTKYNLYAGLSGGFGGATYVGTYEFDTLEKATNEACLLACEVYESYEGCHGIMSWEECEAELRENGEDFDEEDVNLYYMEEKEGWLSYYAVPADEDDNVERND